MKDKLDKLTQKLGFIIIFGSWTGVRTNDQSTIIIGKTKTEYTYYIIGPIRIVIVERNRNG